MNNYQLENDESILFVKQVVVEEFKSEVKFTLTSKKMIFEKEKGIFKRKLKVIDIIPLTNIKVYKEEVQIKQNEENVIIQTIDKNITLSCSNKAEAKNIAEEIINIKTGSNKFGRTSKKATRVVKDVGNVVKGVGSVLKGVGEVAAAVVAIAVPVYKAWKNRNK